MKASAGIDIGDVSGFLGHRHVPTTRKFYAPLANSRLKGASDVLAGRFSGVPSNRRRAIRSSR